MCSRSSPKVWLINPVATDDSAGNAWFVYIVECADKTLYTGVAKDPQRRLAEHNSDNLGAKYTRARQPVRLRYFEEADSRSTACRREASIKKLSRAQKLSLIHTRPAGN